MTTNERGTMFGDVAAPWRSLGVAIKGGSKGVKTAATAIKQAGLDYPVELVPCFAGGGKKGYKRVPDRQVVVAVKEGEKVGIPLGVVGMQYKLIQNSKVFSPFDSIFKDAVEIVRAGELRGGKAVFIQAKVPGNIVLGKGKEKDETERYLFMYTTHDGSGTCQVIPTTHRMWCENMLPLILSNKEEEFTVQIRHSGDIEGEFLKAEELLKLSLVRFDEFAETARALHEVDGDKLFKSYMEELFPNPLAKTKKEASRAMVEAMDTILGEKRAKLEENYVAVQSPQRRNAIAGVNMFYREEKGKSAWNLFQAATSYANHGRKLRVGSKGSTQEKRMQTLLLGDAATFMNRAYDTIKEVALA